jgi:hypothetical protein
VRKTPHAEGGGRRAEGGGARWRRPLPSALRPRPALLVLPAALLLAAASTARFPVAPPPAHTGGFGEPTCQSCHDGNALNDPAGAVELRGLPAAGWTPGERYRLTVVVRRPGMQRGGFEAAARFAAGADSGRQAGRWHAPDARTALTEERAVAYVHHTDLGAEPAADSAAWTVEWTAPASAAAPVVFHVTANAASGDGSAFDDYVYARGFVRAGRRP